MAPVTIDEVTLDKLPIFIEYNDLTRFPWRNSPIVSHDIDAIINGGNTIHVNIAWCFVSWEERWQWVHRINIVTSHRKSVDPLIVRIDDANMAVDNRDLMTAIIESFGDDSSIDNFIAFALEGENAPEPCRTTRSIA